MLRACVTLKRCRGFGQILGSSVLADAISLPGQHSPCQTQPVLWQSSSLQASTTGVLLWHSPRHPKHVLLADSLRRPKDILGSLRLDSFPDLSILNGGLSQHYPLGKSTPQRVIWCSGLVVAIVR